MGAHLGLGLHHVKREAEAEAEADADADAQFFGLAGGVSPTALAATQAGFGIGAVAPIAPIASVAPITPIRTVAPIAPVAVSTPVCTPITRKQCRSVPVQTPRTVQTPECV